MIDERAWLTDPHDYAQDALLNTDTCGLMREIEVDSLSILSDAGFDETTGVDTAMSVQHEGAMLAAGYMMMEIDE